MNTRITDFLSMCRFLNLGVADLAFQRITAVELIEDPIFSDALTYLDHQFIEVVAHAYAASWKIDPLNAEGTPHLASLILPFWQRLVDECPRLNEFWVVYEIAGFTDCGMPVLKAA